MIDRQKLETVLGRRFPGARSDQIAAAANAIMGLEDEWEEVSNPDGCGYQISGYWMDSCSLAREAQAGTEFRVLRRRGERCRLTFAVGFALAQRPGMSGSIAIRAVAHVPKPTIDGVTSPQTLDALITLFGL